MLYRRIMTVCLAIAILFLSGCEKEQKENAKVPEKTTQENIETSYITSATVDVAFETARNVYEAELIDIEKNGDHFRTKVKVLFTYKGDLLPGEEIREDDLYTEYTSIEDLKIGSKYLFMTGVSDKRLEYSSTAVSVKSIFNAVEILDDGGFNVFWYRDNFKYTGYGHKSYYDIVDDMLDLKEIADNIYCCMMKSDRWDTGMSVGQMYVLADNVYIGEVVEKQWSRSATSIVEGYNAGEKVSISKIKVKILSVAKGDYTPGQIIEDVTLGYLQNAGPKESVLVFSGDNFFEGYEEMLK